MIFLVFHFMQFVFHVEKGGKPIQNCYMRKHYVM